MTITPLLTESLLIGALALAIVVATTLQAAATGLPRPATAKRETASPLPGRR